MNPFLNSPPLLSEDSITSAERKLSGGNNQLLPSPGIPADPAHHSVVAAAASKGPWPGEFSQGPSNQLKQTAFFIHSVPGAAAAA